MAEPVVEDIAVQPVRRAAVGFADHSGWAILVAVAGDGSGPEVVTRQRVRLCPPHLPRQPYHAVEGRPIPEAERMVRAVEDAAHEASNSVLSAAAADLGEQGCALVGAAVCRGTAYLPGDLAQILRSHPYLHSAEGELYREALADAAADAGLRVTRFATRDLFAELGAALGAPGSSVQDLIDALGKPLGPPWSKDYKNAAAAAWLALSRASG